MELIKLNSQSQIIKSLIIIFLGSIALAISAKVKIPFYPVPMTMQTFIVLVIGITLGPKFGSIALISYIFEGLIGLPVFAGTPEKGVGITYIIGPTGGYLLGYVTSAYLAGNINFNYSLPIRFFLLIVALSPVYILGLTWLGILFGFDKPLLEWGLVPFVLAEVFKIALLAIFIPKLISYREFIYNKI